MLAPLGVVFALAAAGDFAPLPPDIVMPRSTSRRFVLLADEQLCAGERFALDIQRASGVLWAPTMEATANPWKAALAIRKAQAVGALDVVILELTRGQLALERGAFMKLMDEQLDAIRAVAPQELIVMVAPDVAVGTPPSSVETARLWLNAVFHKRGDGALTFVLLPPAPLVKREDCAAAAEPIANEMRARLTKRQ